ncbi:hypothetical protein VTO42DRAFT_1057 [Malbranchea cinnamomea]
MALTWPSTSLTDFQSERGRNNAKRKLDDSSPSTPPKRTKTLGPFVVDEDDDNEDDAQSYLYADSTSNSANLASQLSSTNLPPDTSQELDVPSPSISSRNALAENNQLCSSERTTGPTVIRTCSGKTIRIPQRKKTVSLSYERMIAARSVTAPGRAVKSYYGIDIHKLLDEAAIDATEKPKPRSPSGIHQSIEVPAPQTPGLKHMNSMWAEKYRARKFTDLIGDERTHRAVLRWLKGWDPIVFPGLAKQRARNKRTDDGTEERQHRKVLLLTGPPGLGKTTLAHVCARQAGYEVLEINASDERSRDVVKNRIRDAVGTENVKGMAVEIGGKKVRKTGRPVCVVVDEVDGVVAGSGGGEGGFMKALVDLILLDQKNSNSKVGFTQTFKRKGKKGDSFRLLRPMILICNDVYHPSLRPLRTSFLAEIIHVRRVPLEQVVQRTKRVFEKEGIQCDGDGVRKLCEASWGMGGSRDRGSFTRGVSEGDIRSVMVTAEWIAQQLRASGSSARLTRKWVEQHILNNSLQNGSSRGLGRGGTREIVERVFLDGAGFPYKHGTTKFHDPFSESGGPGAVGVAELRKRHAMDLLREMVDAAGEYDRCITDCWLAYPTQPYQDDTILSKPNAAYDWLFFHDSISTRLFSHQDWELNSYLSQSVAAFHHLFASSDRPHGKSFEDGEDDDEEKHPFSGPRADFAAFEAEKQNRSIIIEFRSSLPAQLLRSFRSPDTIATELVPSLMRMLAPNVKPVVIGGSGGQGSIATVRKESERALVKAAVGVMHGVGITFEKARVEMETGNYGGFIYRMEPPLDVLTSFSKVKGTPLATTGSSGPVRYAIRQVLEQEYRKEVVRRQAELQQKRLGGAEASPASEFASVTGNKAKSDDTTSKLFSLSSGPKRDFFGRIIADKPVETNTHGTDKNNDQTASNKGHSKGKEDKELKVWVSYHEGFSNAVRKVITMKELLSSL